MAATWRQWARTHLWVHLVLQCLFWAGVGRHIELPGLFMDAVNPDFLAARILFPELHNPVDALPSVVGPMLGNLYHGVENLYVGLPVFALFGMNLVTLRVAQALFGAGIVALTYELARRLSGQWLVAALAAAALATDIALIASFRTQFYIVLGGEVWLLAALLCLWHDFPRAPSERAAMWTGFFGGLALYGYFVYAFFAPALLWYLWRFAQRRALVLASIKGLALGLVPYLVGYASLFAALGGIGPGWQWMQAQLGGLGPLASDLSGLERVAIAYRNAAYSVQNIGNELMIFGAAADGAWAQQRWTLVLAALLWSVVQLVRNRLRGLAVGSAADRWHLVWLPMAFFGLSLLFGGRLWVHHYITLVSCGYLLLALVLGQAVAWVSTRKGVSWARPAASVMALVLGLVCIAQNGIQQQNFFERLEHTGGVGRFSDALNRLAADATRADRPALWVFPEWGFYMPFALLTNNRVPYAKELSLSTLRAQCQQGRQIKLAYWAGNEEAAARYRTALDEAHCQLQAEQAYEQRDGKPAFRVLIAGPGQAPAH